MKRLYVMSIFETAAQNQFRSALLHGINGTLYARLTGGHNPFFIRTNLKAFFTYFGKDGSTFYPILPMR